MRTIRAKTPALPESESDVKVIKWLKEIGEEVKRNDAIAEIETSKVILEIPSPCFGIIKEYCVEIGQILRSAQDLLVVEVHETHEVLESSYLETEKRLQERKEKYCCEWMFDAVNNAAPLKFECTFIRGEGLWEMKAPNGDTLGYAQHCPWCGYKLSQSFE